MMRHWITMAASVCALALAPSTALAGNGSGGLVGSLVQQAQTATNENTTEQSATSEASSKQTNVNAPVAIDSPGSNNGDVNQSNEANTKASSENNNNTEQSNEQSQKGSATGKDQGGKGSWSKGNSCGCKGDHEKGKEQGKHSQGSGSQSVEQNQSGSNSNSTDQSAKSSASNEQTNVNEPYSKGSSGNGDDHGSSCGCDGKGGGDVNQSNDAHTNASSKNNNGTAQRNEQSQEGSVSS
jgi:hypothetical protein